MILWLESWLEKTIDARFGEDTVFHCKNTSFHSTRTLLISSNMINNMDRIASYPLLVKEGLLCRNLLKHRKCRWLLLSPRCIDPRCIDPSCLAMRPPQDPKVARALPQTEAAEG